jgi:hypothetical protein
MNGEVVDGHISVIPEVIVSRQISPPRMCVDQHAWHVPHVLVRHAECIFSNRREKITLPPLFARVSMSQQILLAWSRAALP